MNQERNQTVDAIYEVLSSALKPESDSKMFTLNSLWLTDTRKRHYVGDEVFYDENKEEIRIEPMWENERTTHKITALRGNLRDTHHEIDLEDLNDGSLLTVKL
jgi:hypothetical protein